MRLNISCHLDEMLTSKEPQNNGIVKLSMSQVHKSYTHTQFCQLAHVQYCMTQILSLLNSCFRFNTIVFMLTSTITTLKTPEGISLIQNDLRAFEPLSLHCDIHYNRQLLAM